jgi:hypothetical protein
LIKLTDVYFIHYVIRNKNELNGTAAATEEFVGGLIGASIGGKVGNRDGLVVFIATVGEGKQLVLKIHIE